MRFFVFSAVALALFSNNNVHGYKKAATNLGQYGPNVGAEEGAVDDYNKKNIRKDLVKDGWAAEKTLEEGNAKFGKQQWAGDNKKGKDTEYGGVEGGFGKGKKDEKGYGQEAGYDFGSEKKWAGGEAGKEVGKGYEAEGGFEKEKGYGKKTSDFNQKEGGFEGSYDQSQGGYNSGKGGKSFAGGYGADKVEGGFQKDGDIGSKGGYDFGAEKKWAGGGSGKEYKKEAGYGGDKLGKGYGAEESFGKEKGGYDFGGEKKWAGGESGKEYKKDAGYGGDKLGKGYGAEESFGKEKGGFEGSYGGSFSEGGHAAGKFGKGYAEEGFGKGKGGFGDEKMSGIGDFGSPKGGIRESGYEAGWKGDKKGYAEEGFGKGKGGFGEEKMTGIEGYDGPKGGMHEPGYSGGWKGGYGETNPGKYGGNRFGGGMTGYNRGGSFGGFDELPRPFGRTKMTVKTCNKMMDSLLGHLQTGYTKRIAPIVKLPQLPPTSLGGWGKIAFYDGAFQNLKGKICRGGDFKVIPQGDVVLVTGIVSIPEPRIRYHADAFLYNKLKVRNRPMHFCAKNADFRFQMAVNKKMGHIEVADLEPMKIDGFHFEDEKGDPKHLVWPFNKIQGPAMEESKITFANQLTGVLCDEFRTMVKRPEVKDEIISQV